VARAHHVALCPGGCCLLSPSATLNALTPHPGDMGNIVLEIVSIIIDINCQNMKVMMGVTRRDVLFD
jgi:hypothetical protein